MTKKSFALFFGCIICFSLILSGCVSTSSSTKTNKGKTKNPETIKIGVMYPTSGAMESVGKEQVKGIEFATKIINEKYDLPIPLAKEKGLPNLGGAKIELVIVDTEGSPKTAIAIAEKLITEEKVAAIIGSYASSNTAAASQTAERHGIPFLNAESTSHHLTERGYKWFFRTNADNYLSTESLFTFYNQLEEKYSTVNTISSVYENTEFGQESAEAQKMFAEESGREIVSDIAYINNSNDLMSEALQIRKANSNVLMISSDIKDAILFQQLLKQQNSLPDAIIGMGTGFEDSNHVIGKDAEGMLISSGWSADLLDTKPLIKEVNELYKAETGTDLTDATPQAITGLLILADAINRAGSVEPEKIRTALLATDYPAESLIMPWKGVRFDQETQQNQLAHNVLLQVKDETEKLVWPFDMASEELVWPLVPAKD